MKQNMSAVAASILAALFFFLTLLFLSAGISNACRLQAALSIPTLHSMIYLNES